MVLNSEVVAVEGDPPLSLILVEKFPHERKVRLAVRVALMAIVRPMTETMLNVSDTFDLIESELSSLRTWLEAQVQQAKERNEHL